MKVPQSLVRLVILGFLAGFAFLRAEVGAEEQSAGITFHIRAAPLSEALVNLAMQAKLSIGHPGVDFNGIVANPVDGRFSPQEALTSLLAGTGYGFVLLDSQTVQIYRSAQNRPTPSSAAPLLEEVFVTATKRPAVAQRLPYSVSVVTGADLDDPGSTIANDLAGHAAALTATNLGAGEDKLFIRGLSDSVFTGRSQSTVGLYLDESRVTDDTPDPDLQLVDIDKVEVLRGPQGTLYGAGTLGGLIRIITNRPALGHFEAMESTSVAAIEAGDPSYAANTTLNIPILRDVLGLRIVGYINTSGGYIDDIRLHRNNVNHSDKKGARLSLLWRPADDWAITFGITDQKISSADSQYFQTGLPTFKRANFEPEPHQDRFLQSSLTVERPLGRTNITSSVAFTDRQIANQYDASLAWQTLTGLPNGPSTFNDVRNVYSLTHETRLASVDDGPWTWISGIFFSHRDEEYRSRLSGPGQGGVPFAAKAVARSDHDDEAALFGEATYQPFQWISLTAGARLFYSADAASSQIRVPATGVAAIAAGTNSAGGITRKIIVNVHPNEDLTFYSSALEGFRLGGVNINSPSSAFNANAPTGDEQDGAPNADAFASDHLWTYEIGGKSTLFNGRLIANGAAYLTLWTSVQSDQILPDGSLFIANVGNVRNPGFETDLTWQATKYLRLRANYFWNDPKIVRPNPLLVQASGRLPGVSERSFGFSARYDRPVGSEYNCFVNLDYAYVGKSYVGFNEKSSATMGDYFTSSLRLGLLHDQWQATLYVNNITNEQANSFAYGNPFSFGRIGQITPLQPRTIGFGLSWNY